MIEDEGELVALDMYDQEIKAGDKIVYGYKRSCSIAMRRAEVLVVLPGGRLRIAWADNDPHWDSKAKKWSDEKRMRISTQYSKHGRIRINER